MEPTVAVVGLGYVGLPLAVAFGEKMRTIGFDIQSNRISELETGVDRTLETTPAELAAATKLSYTSDPAELAEANVYIVTVPTPIDTAKRPDLGPLISASKTIGSLLSPGDYVIYESTVYPGATEEDCVPILEQVSGLRCNEDFFVGYSPERINPGDKTHRLADIRKVTSGSTPEAADFVDELYGHIITAGTHKAASIKVAEAAKVIENTQRDVNIALVNELAVLFDTMGIDTIDVLEAAGTKWNFLPFRPGLVGGHCIGVDPYYLTHKAQEVGHHPEVILAGRRINDRMGEHVADRVVLEMARAGEAIAGARVLILGLAFKENCPDIRNTRVTDIINRLEQYGIEPVVMDPWVDATEAKAEYGIDVQPFSEDALPTDSFGAIVLAVAHQQFVELDGAILANLPTKVVYDVKSAWPKDVVTKRL